MSAPAVVWTEADAATMYRWRDYVRARAVAGDRSAVGRMARLAKSSMHRAACEVLLDVAGLYGIGNYARWQRRRGNR